jgi:menaquinone-specific isochorismate synthase
MAPPVTSPPRDAADLVATTRRIAGGDTGVDARHLDLLAASGPDGLFWQHEDDGLAGRGVALRITLPDGLEGQGSRAVTDALAVIERDDQMRGPGTGAVALGALPFTRGASGSLVVPEVVVGRKGDDGWVTVVSRRDDPSGVESLAASMQAAAISGERDRANPPSQFTLTSVLDHDEFEDLVAAAVERIGGGALGKVVLARRIDVEANRPFVTSDVLSRLLALYPTCMVFRIDGFLGASPELLIERHGRHVASHPLAGTIARSGDIATDETLIAGLLASAKDRREHAYVIDALHRELATVCDDLDVPDKPSVLELRNVSHLATHITGVLTAPAPTALDLVARVHPTPAVGGTPTAAATAYIAEVEGFDRGRYAGPVGWMDANGDGTWAIGLRSADVDGERASMYAGVGLVTGSDPVSELAETQLKLQALLAALVRP